jgi:hypothetical protein
MELNILNKKLNADSDTFHEKTEYEFWYIYCQLLNFRNPVLTDKDCAILAQILTLYNSGESVLTKDLEEKTKTGMTNLYAKCKQLVEKGFLIKTNEGYFINPAFSSFQRYIKNTTNKNIKFTIPISICQ